MIHSSTAEQRAVNSKVPGSNPGGSAMGVTSHIGASAKSLDGLLPCQKKEWADKSP